MHPDSIRFALVTIFESLCEATALATGKPIGEFSGHLMRVRAIQQITGRTLLRVARSPRWRVACGFVDIKAAVDVRLS
jgi:hypothetical protein